MHASCCAAPCSAHAADQTIVHQSPAALCPGDVWHIALEGLPGSRICYGYKVSGDGGWDTGMRWYPDRVLVDPYAPLLNGRRFFGRRDGIEHFTSGVSTSVLYG